MQTLILLLLVGSSMCQNTPPDCEEGGGCRQISTTFINPANIHRNEYEAITGENLQLSCRATKNFKKESLKMCIRNVASSDDAKCAYGTRHTCQQQCNVTYNRLNIQPEQATTYCCNASTNAFFPDEGTCLRIDVAEERLLMFRTNLPSNKSVTDGEELRLECSAKGYPKPLYTWLHEGEVLTDHENTPSGVLVIDSVTESNGGKYQCIIHNRLYTRKSSKVSVYVGQKGVLETHYIYLIGGACLIVITLVIGVSCGVYKRFKKPNNGVGIHGYGPIDDHSVPTTPLHTEDGTDDNVMEHEEFFHGGYDEPYHGDLQGDNQPKLETDGSPGTSSEININNGGINVIQVHANIVHINNNNSGPTMIQSGKENTAVFQSDSSSSASSSTESPPSFYRVEDSMRGNDGQSTGDVARPQNSPVEISDTSYNVDVQKGDPLSSSDENVGETVSVEGHTSCKTLVDDACENIHGKSPQEVSLCAVEASENPRLRHSSQTAGRSEGATKECHSSSSKRATENSYRSDEATDSCWANGAGEHSCQCTSCKPQRDHSGSEVLEENYNVHDLKLGCYDLE